MIIGTRPAPFEDDGRRFAAARAKPLAPLRVRIGRMVRLALLLLLPVVLAVRSGPGAAGSPAATASAYTIQGVLVTGEAAPGGGAFTQFSDPALNDRGDLAFAASTSAPGARYAVFLLKDGRLRSLAVAGRPAPPGGTFTAFNDVVLSARAPVAFPGRTTDRVAHQGLYRARA